MICGHCRRRDDDITLKHVRNCGKVFTVNDVEQLLAQAAPPLHSLLDGIAIAKRESRDDLRDRCIQYAIAAVTGETPDHEVRNLAREAAHRMLEAATEGSLHADAVVASQRLRGLSPRDPRLAEELSRKSDTLERIALYLSRATAPAFVSASSALRQMQRSDLALVVASRAVHMAPDEAPPRVTLAAALIDLLRAEEGLRESMVGENLEPSSYTSSTISRAHRVLEQLDEAISWAEETIRRDPDSKVGYSVLMAAATAADDQERRERAAAFLHDGAGQTRSWSREYVDFLTAIELIKTGDQGRGLQILRRLASFFCQPAVRKLLEFESQPPGSRPTDQRPPR